MEPPREGSPFNACSTLLSMDCQIMDQQSASKAASSGGQGGAGLQQALNLTKKNSASGNNDKIDDDFGKEEENAQNSSMLQGSMIFDMLSAMQFNAHSTIHEQAHIHDNSLLNISTPSASTQKAANRSSNNNNTIISPEGSPPWHLHLYNNNHARADAPYIQALPMDHNNMQQSAAPPISTFDPIASFLKLPVLADQTQLGLASDQRLTSSTYLNSSHKDQDPLYHIGPAAAQAYNSVATNNNWFSSLQLESIRDCSNDNSVVQHLDHHHHHHHHHLGGASELEAKLLMKLNGEETTISSHDKLGSHEERLMLNESYNSTSMHMLHNEEQLLYTLNNEGGDNIIEIEGGHGSGMFENMHMMQMMGYSNDPSANADFGGAVIKGISTCSSIMGATGKTTRKRGVRGSGKNSEDRENQRMTHIAVERNRRRQMNEHLRVLRALMPPSYIQRGDQASIIGGAIEFVRELEQLLQCLESQKRRRIMVSPVNAVPQPPSTFQPCLVNAQATTGFGAPSSNDHHLQHQLQAIPYMQDEGGLQNLQEEVAQAKSAVADIEVKVVEKSEALIKILSQRRPRQLLLTIQALQEHLHLSILHTNVTTIDNTVLYSFTVKIHHDCDYSANHIATLVHEIFIDIIEQKPIKDI